MSRSTSALVSVPAVTFPVMSRPASRLFSVPATIHRCRNRLAGSQGGKIPAPVIVIDPPTFRPAVAEPIEPAAEIVAVSLKPVPAVMDEIPPPEAVIVPATFRVADTVPIVPLAVTEAAPVKLPAVTDPILPAVAAAEPLKVRPTVTLPDPPYPYPSPPNVAAVADPLMSRPTEIEPMPPSAVMSPSRS